MRTEFPANLEVRLRRHVIALASTPRPPGSAAHDAAREYVHRHLCQAGFSPYFEADRGFDLSCINTFCKPVPERLDLPLVIIGAHYDSTPTTPGADDNASAVAALIELAYWLRPQLQRAERWATARLQLVAYDLEEYGMIGSTLHAQQLADPVRCMISLEMLGFTDKRPGGQKLPPHLVGIYPNVGDFIGVCGNDNSLRWMNTVAEAMKAVPGLPVESLAVPGNGEMLPPVRLSDHSSFWDKGYPALMVTDTSFFRNPHYHQETDTPDTLDYPFLAKVTQGMGMAALRLLAAE